MVYTTTWISVTRIAQHAYGVAAQHVGIPMNIYRISPNSSGDWIQPQNLYAQNRRVDRQPSPAGNKGFETSKKNEVFWFELMADCNDLLVGDVFVSTDPVLNKGWVTVNYDSTEFIGLCLAENMPTRAPVAARLNTMAQFFTPSISPSTQTGLVPVQNYYDSTLPNKQAIILENGKFTRANAGQIAANIPIAFMPFRNFGEIYNQPTMNVTGSERRLIYVPPMNGYQPVAGDEFVIVDGSRYVMESNYHQDSGTAGNQFVCFKIVSGGGQ